MLRLHVICDDDQVQWGMNHKVFRLELQRKTPRFHRPALRCGWRSKEMKRIRRFYVYHVNVSRTLVPTIRPGRFQG